MFFPSKERVHPADVFPGMVFFIVDTQWGQGALVGTDLLDGPFTVLCNFNDRGEGSRSEGYNILLLGPGPRLVWREQLGWIRRVADPVWEARWERRMAEDRARELAARLTDTALALGA